MTLTQGARLGPYEIVAAIGAGGMGEVFRARDTKLNRDVAIKVLPAAFADDPERLARFTREAQTLASLNHPNIATIYGIEEVAGIASSASSAELVAMTEGSNPRGATVGVGASRVLAMELIEGEDLSALMARGPVPIAETQPIARQIAEALEAAHEQGIVHRDLKPGNIKVRTSGTVKALDFGLAKAPESEQFMGVRDPLSRRRKWAADEARYTRAVKSVADDLRQEQLRRQQSMSAMDRILLSLALGENAARQFADLHGVSLEAAKRALQRQRQTGRKRSACHDGLLA